jgi:hypothetical protein
MKRVLEFNQISPIYETGMIYVYVSPTRIIVLYIKLVEVLREDSYPALFSVNHSESPDFPDDLHLLLGSCFPINSKQTIYLQVWSSVL